MREDKYYKRLVADSNIFLALYSVNSYICNRELLIKDDRNSLNRLKDIFDKENIDGWIEKIENRLEGLINGDDYLKAKVFFKPKKFENNKAIFRPIHHSSLLDQITAVAMLNILIYNFDDKNKVEKSNLSRLIPHNFYGNRVAYDVEHLFVPWEVQYKKYTKITNENYRRFHENSRYKWEVDLDLKDFFPSVNPSTLYNYVADKLPANLHEDEKNTLLKIVEKLIFVEIDKLNKNDLKRYRGEDSSFSCRFAQGIPQGLPQSYFFANLLMIEIEKKYRKAFPESEMFFYVDDSVIFTNEIKSECDLEKKIKGINKDIKIWIEGEISNKNMHLSNYLFEYVNERKSSYGIEIHCPGEKSTASDISKSRPSEIYLNCIGRETSKTSFELNTSYSDEENISLLHKTEKLKIAVEKELEDINRQIKEANNNEKIGLEAYKKKLIRYKKFFKYRNFELATRTNRVDKDSLFDFVYTLRNIVRTKNIELLFQNFTEDIFISLLSIILRERKNSGKKSIGLLILLRKLNSLLFDCENKKTSYLYQAFSRYLDDEQECNIEDRKYFSLKRKLAGQIHFFQKKDEFFRRNKAEELLTKAISKSILDIKMGKEYANKVCLVDANSSRIHQSVLNAYISAILGFEISDEYLLQKKISRKITYTELRILEMLRSKKFNEKSFFNLVDDAFNLEFDCAIDYSIFQVMGYFRTYVSDAERVDNIILVHKYTCDIWKNGSKHLYFYTLHNQEHACDLVKNTVKLVRTIDYLDIKQYDYYILFIASYLHDISMVTFPILDSLQDNSYESDEIYNDFVNDVRKSLECDNLSDKSVKKMLADYYIKVDEFYERRIRSNHAKDSAKEIRTRKELFFIDSAIREIVAEVSEAHGYNIADVYYKKSSAQSQNWSEKYTKILLRLADVLDMSNYRVSKVILNHNIENMGKVSRFHWLSHIVTKGYKLEVKYELKDDICDNYLKRENISEIIQLYIYVDLPQFTKVDSPECERMRLISMSDGGIKLKCGKKCQPESSCNFLCKWFAKKNYYLMMELDALRNYLNSVPNNYFDTTIEVIVKTSNNSILSPEQFSYLSKCIDEY